MTELLSMDQAFIEVLRDIVLTYPPEVEFSGRDLANKDALSIVNVKPRSYLFLSRLF